MAYNKIIYGGKTLLDLTEDSVTPESLKKGYTAHQANGEKIVGTYMPNSGTDDEIDSILLHGFSYGEVEYTDNGSVITAVNKTTGQILTKTFSGNFCTITLKDLSGVELGKLVKTYLNDSKVITSVNHHNGTTGVKTFASDSIMTEEIKDTMTGDVISSLTKKLVV